MDGKEKSIYYNRNRWGIEAREIREGEKNLEIELINREKDVQRQWEDNKIAKARYNKKYKEIRLEGKVPRYLKKENIEDLNKGDEVRALKLRC